MKKTRKSEWRIILGIYKNWYNFKGRATRREFWLFHALCLITFLAMVVTDKPWSNIFVVIFIVSVIPYIAVSARRLHDIGMSGLWLIPYFFTFYAQPPIGVIAFLGMSILLIWKSQKGENKYGPNLFDEFNQTKDSDKTVLSKYSIEKLPTLINRSRNDDAHQ